MSTLFTRRALVILAGVALTLTTVVGTASPAAAAQQYKTTATVTVRTGPGTNYPLATTYQNVNGQTASSTILSGTTITVVCQHQGGTSVNGNRTWDKLGEGAWITDYYTTSPSFNSYAPGLGPCDGVPSPSCYGPRCINVDPQNNSNCAAGDRAKTVDGTTVTPPGGGGTVWLRWSAYCAANWAQASNISGARWWVEGNGGPQGQAFGNAYFSRMVDGTRGARVCIQAISAYNAPTCSPWK